MPWRRWCFAVLLWCAGTALLMAQQAPAAAQNYQDLIHQAEQFMQEKQYPKAADVLRDAMALDPKNSVAYYDNACLLSLVGKPVDALHFLKDAVQRGYLDLPHINSDPDLVNLRKLPAFQEYMEELTPKPDLRIPQDYDKSRSYPLLVFLHGAQSNPAEFRDFLEAELMDTEYFILCPPGGLLITTTTYTWNPATDTERILKCIDATVAKYNIDRSRIYLGGFSAGAVMTYVVGLQNPGRFAGLLPCSGALQQQYLTPELLKAAQAVPVFMIQGTQDDAGLVRLAQATLKTLRDNGNPALLYPFEGGHVLPVPFYDVFVQAMMFLNQHRAVSAAK